MPSNVSLPTITGTPRVGQSLSGSPGQWTVDTPGDILSYDYEWLRCDLAGDNCNPISGAIAPSYLLQAADLGSRLRLQVTANETTPASPDYPDSYFTGPLGENNVVPTDPDGAIVITWTGRQGMGVAQTRAMLQQRWADCGRVWDGVQAQIDALTAADANTETWIHQQGCIPCITWTPGGLSTSQINGGAADAAITAVANRFASAGFRIMLRIYHEFDGPWNSYYGLGNPTMFINAWRRTVALFQTAGADNVGFWWCPGELGGNPQRAAVNACYPGEAYVDWVGSDGYNRNSADFSTPLHGGWAEFEEINNYDAHGFTTNLSMCNQWGPVKPFITGETGCKYDPGNASRKANWFRHIDTVAKDALPYLRGIAFFDVDVTQQEEHDWRVDSNQPAGTSLPGSVDATTYQGFKDFVATPRWNVGVVGGAT